MAERPLCGAPRTHDGELNHPGENCKSRYPQKSLHATPPQHELRPNRGGAKPASPSWAGTSATPPRPRHSTPPAPLVHDTAPPLASNWQFPVCARGQTRQARTMHDVFRRAFIGLAQLARRCSIRLPVLGSEDSPFAQCIHDTRKWGGRQIATAVRLENKTRYCPVFFSM